VQGQYPPKLNIRDPALSAQNAIRSASGPRYGFIRIGMPSASFQTILESYCLGCRDITDATAIYSHYDDMVCSFS